MRTRIIVSLLAAMILTGPASGNGPVGGRGHRRSRGFMPAEEASPSPSPATAPSAQLSQLTATHLDNVLAPIDQTVTLPWSEVSQLRTDFSSEMATAPDAEKPKYEAAIAVCDALNAAMDEREKLIADRHDNPPAAQEVRDARVGLSRHGRATGKAARAAQRQEAHENRSDKAEEKTTPAKQWADRSAELRQNIQAAISREQDAERAAPPPAPSAAPAPSPSAP
ncbi:MAG TPA: hypothetical protein VGG02_05090 [Chthoniobacterales bacterium]